MIIRVEIG